MKSKRIYQIAKELNISHIEILKFLKNKDVSVANHMAPVNVDIYDMILIEFSKEKANIDRIRKEKARTESIKSKDDLLSKAALDSTINDANDDSLTTKPKSVEIKADDKSSETEKKVAPIPDRTPTTLKKTAPKLKKIDLSAITDKINNKNKLKSKVEKASLNSITSSKKKQKKKIKKKKTSVEISEEVSSLLKVPEFSTVDELAQSMKVSAQDVIMKCMDLGLMVSINQRLDMDTIIMVADEFDFEVEALDIYSEDAKEEDKEIEKNLSPRPPVVTIMGHVDHGKTSLLDYIRNTNVIAGESGGITQHIGAYKVEVRDKTITFIDTPGHAAFTAMRARGAQVTDIVILIIAADDSIMPQTIEAIDHAKAANVPIIIAINKIDLPGANIDKVKKELSEKGILVEDWGGKYQCAEISAKKGTGIDDLIDKILVESELLD